MIICLLDLPPTPPLSWGGGILVFYEEFFLGHDMNILVNVFKSQRFAKVFFFSGIGQKFPLRETVKNLQNPEHPTPPLNAGTGFLLLEPDFADNMSATAAPFPYESNLGRGGGCLGFFVY
jgi:hypothetical protein